MAQGLHNLGPRKGATQSKKRVGRGPGSGLGKTSGRGHKGQNSRSGYSHLRGHEGGQMPLHRRVPKRGFTNIFRKEWETISIERLATLAGAGESVTPATLSALGAIKKDKQLKVLGNGELKKELVVYAHRFTEGAKKKIEAAGGRCEVLTAAK